MKLNLLNSDYLNQFKRNISSKYSQGLFLQTQAKNGMIYNVFSIFLICSNQIINYPNKTSSYLDYCW